MAEDVPSFDTRSLSDRVADHIRDLIIEGHLDLGDRIDEAKLIGRMGISRTPFREALRTLAAEGLVELRPSRGAVVRKMTAVEVHSMLEVLAHLERLAGRLACERASKSEIAALLDIHERMAALHQARDRMPYYKLNQSFHSRLTEAAGNPTLVETQARLQARLKRIRFIGNRRPEYWDAAMAEHARMAEALHVRDGERLGALMAEHLMQTWHRVRAVVEEASDDVRP